MNRHMHTNSLYERAAMRAAYPGHHALRTEVNESFTI